MKDAEARLTELEAKITETESLVRGLRQENARLREALGARSLDAGGEPSEQSAGRSYRLVALEAERDEVRSRLRALLGIL